MYENRELPARSHSGFERFVPRFSISRCPGSPAHAGFACDGVVVPRYPDTPMPQHLPCTYAFDIVATRETLRIFDDPHRTTFSPDSRSGSSKAAATASISPQRE